MNLFLKTLTLRILKKIQSINFFVVFSVFFLTNNILIGILPININIFLFSIFCQFVLYDGIEN